MYRRKSSTLGSTGFPVQLHLQLPLSTTSLKNMAGAFSNLNPYPLIGLSAQRPSSPRSPQTRKFFVPRKLSEPNIASACDSVSLESGLSLWTKISRESDLEGTSKLPLATSTAVGL